MAAALIVTLGLIAPVLPGEGASQAAAQQFHPMPCPDGVFAEDVDVDCGYVQVPEDRNRPGGRQIRVAAAYVHAQSAHPAPDPIVFLDGGPSFGAIAPFALDLYFAGASFAADRDLVLVDTRGTGFSTPRLGCPELDQAEVDAFYAGPTVNSRAGRIYARALSDCRARLVGAGIDPAAYDTTESAADLEALRRALGVHRWNLLAISADGNLGLTYLRMFPGGIRSAVIDSGTSTNVLWGLDYDRGRVAQLERVFAGCRANPACRATYPGIRRKFYRLVREYNRHPLYLTIEDFEPEPATFPIDGAGLLTDAINLIYPGDAGYEETIHLLLDVVWFWVHGGVEEDYRAALGTGPVENGHVDEGLAQGKSMSYLCRDMVGFVTWRDRVEAAVTSPRSRRDTSTRATTSTTAGATPLTGRLPVVAGGGGRPGAARAGHQRDPDTRPRRRVRRGHAGGHGAADAVRAVAVDVRRAAGGRPPAARVVHQRQRLRPGHRRRLPHTSAGSGRHQLRR